MNFRRMSLIAVCIVAAVSCGIDSTAARFGIQLAAALGLFLLARQPADSLLAAGVISAALAVVAIWHQPPFVFPLVICFALLFYAHPKPQSAPGHPIERAGERAGSLDDRTQIDHDLRNYLLVISAATARLKDLEDIPSQTAAWLQQIANAANRASGLIERSPSDEQGTASVNDVVRRVATMCEPLHARLVLDLSSDAATDIPDGLLERALLNLVLNAVEAAPEGRIHIRSRVDKSGEPLQATIDVEDDGPGMTDTELAEKKTSTKGENRGVGLIVVRSIMLAFQGSFHLSSRTSPASGCIAQVRFPATASPDQPSPDQPSPDQPSPDQPSPPERSMRTILVVEDNDQVQNAVAGLLAAMGWNVRTAKTGAEAIEHLQSQGEAEVVLLDYSLPDLTGAEVIAELERQGIEIPIVLSSGHGNNLDSSGLEHVPLRLSKPYRADALKSALDEALRDK